MFNIKNIFRLIIPSVFILYFLIIISVTNLYGAENKTINDKLNIPELNPVNFLPDKSEVPNVFLRTIKNLSSLLDLHTNSNDPFPCPRDELKSLTPLQNANERGLRDDAWFLSGIIHDICGNYREANEAYTKSLGLRRRNKNLLFLAGVVKFRLESYVQGKNLLNEAEWLEFKKPHLIKYILGLESLQNGKMEEAIKYFDSSLKSKENFLPSMMEGYLIRKNMRSNVTSQSQASKLDAELSHIMVQLNRLDSGNREMAIEYLRYLLLTGDPLTSPTKLIEGENLASTWIKRSKEPDDDILLMKVQILEKRGKKKDAYEQILEREEIGTPLSAALQLKKAQFAEHLENIE
ncbi:MAG TPA: hypothetical protein PKA63_03195 [Oligoflexia bacterium]|nr:hypothetical protein [Oligoflexia bacterium]HMP47661.1 hypothetical protein [Oligoflexia bacterium]